MTSTAKETRSKHDPYGRDLPGGGKMAILVALILGAAVVVAVFILWQAHERRILMTRQAEVEEEVRVDLRQAYQLLRGRRPEQALAVIREVEKKMEIFPANSAGDYADLKVVRLLIEAESEFLLDRQGNAAEVEETFTEAIGLMIRANGEIWEMGVMGRARARFEQGKYGEALADLDTLLAGNRNYGNAYYWRALAKERMGDELGALADERVARNLDSWPPLRDFMHGGGTAVRDVLR